MSTAKTEAELRMRISELEHKVEFLYRHLGVTYIAPAPAVPPEILAALRAGNLVEAIRLYRLTYNVDLAAAKQGVEQLRAQLM